MSDISSWSSAGIADRLASCKNCFRLCLGVRREVKGKKSVEHVGGWWHDSVHVLNMRTLVHSKINHQSKTDLPWGIQCRGLPQDKCSSLQTLQLKQPVQLLVRRPCSPDEDMTSHSKSVMPCWMRQLDSGGSGRLRRKGLHKNKLDQKKNKQTKEQRGRTCIQSVDLPIVVIVSHPPI